MFNFVAAYFSGLLGQYVRWDVVALLLTMGILAGLETLAVINGHYLTITDWIKSWMPMPIRIIILSWLWWHFVGSDLWPNYKPYN